MVGIHPNQRCLIHIQYLRLKVIYSKHSLFSYYSPIPHEFMTIVNTISLSLSLTLANEETFENTLSDMYLENFLYNAETNQNNGFIAEKDVNWTPHVAPQIGKKSWET